MERRRLNTTLLETTNWVRVRLGLNPRCEWVRNRFGAYFKFELSPAEFLAMERHLQTCPHCAQEWQETEAALEELEALTPIGRQLQSVSEEEFMAELWTKIDAAEEEEVRARKRISSDPARERWNARNFPAWLPRLAYAVLLFLSLSALAYLGPHVRRQMAGPRAMDRAAAWTDRPSAKPQLMQAGAPRSDGTGAGRLPDATPVWPLKPLSQCSAFNLEPELDSQIDQVVAEIRVRMLLPQTEAEWEAWARKEYPHIMWLYDVLTKPENGINWDGKPVNIPEWAQRIWNDPAVRPTGWRALVFYSGEILKFDFPDSIESPNVRPTIHAMQLSAAVAGFDLRLDAEGQYRFPPILKVKLDVKIPGNAEDRVSLNKYLSKPNMNTTSISKVHLIGEHVAIDYSNRIFRDEKQFIRTLLYITITTLCLPDTQQQNMPAYGKILLAAFQKPGRVTCDITELQICFKSLMLQYSKMLSDSIAMERR